MKLTLSIVDAVAAGLNPFEFRAGLKLWLRGLTPRKCLNPFEFRAGLKPIVCGSIFRVSRLNPFEFRAGLKRFGWSLILL